MKDNASSTFLLSPGSPDEQDEYKRRFELSDDQMEELSMHLRGPGEEGAPVYAIHDVKDRGRVIQPGYLKLGKLWLWALCSTENDVLLRRELSSRVGFFEGLSLLSRQLPGGEVGKVADMFKARLASLGGEEGKKAQDEWIKVLASHLLAYSKMDMEAIYAGRKAIDRSLL